MNFLPIWIDGLVIIIAMMVILWLISIIITNVSIVDIFWGTGFVLSAIIYFLKSGEANPQKIIVLVLVSLWGLRLSVHLAIRNAGKGEDFRYKQFRKNYGARRYWWISFFQVFLLQGILMWLISASVLGAMLNSAGNILNILFIAGLISWVTGFLFEAGGDFQLTRFRSDPKNKGKVLDKGFWKYTRHPNYFGDSAVWWAYGLFSVASDNYPAALGSVLMTFLIIRVSGVQLLEKSLGNKPGYDEYIRKTSAFLPWFPKK